MTHIDFIIGFILLMSAIFMVMYFATSSISNNVNEVVASDMAESSLALEKYFFGAQNDNILMGYAKEIDVMINERDSLAHTEDVSISIMPGAGNVGLYDDFWNETVTSIIQSSGQTSLSARIDLAPNENKSLKVVYFGEEANEVTYSSSGNATAVIVAGKEIRVVSQERCSSLSARAYSDVKTSIDFGHNFRIDLPGCSYGPSNPSKANIIIRNVPILLENPDGTITTAIARLSIW
jgi:hypothetical protein